MLKYGFSGVDKNQGQVNISPRPYEPPTFGYEAIARSIEGIGKSVETAIGKRRELDFKIAAEKFKLDQAKAESMTPENILGGLDAQGNPSPYGGMISDFTLDPHGRVAGALREPNEPEIERARTIQAARIQQQIQSEMLREKLMAPANEQRISEIADALRAARPELGYEEIAPPSGEEGPAQRVPSPRANQIARGIVVGGPKVADLLRETQKQESITDRAQINVAGRQNVAETQAESKVEVAKIKTASDLLRARERQAYDLVKEDRELENELKLIGARLEADSKRILLKEDSEKRIRDYIKAQGISETDELRIMTKLQADLSYSPFFMRDLNGERAAEGLSPYKNIEEYAIDYIERFKASRSGIAPATPAPTQNTNGSSLEEIKKRTKKQ